MGSCRQGSPKVFASCLSSGKSLVHTTSEEGRSPSACTLHGGSAYPELRSNRANKPIDARIDKTSEFKASIRKVEHLFQVIKRQFSYVKVPKLV
jgi:hypothetical protein